MHRTRHRHHSPTLRRTRLAVAAALLALTVGLTATPAALADPGDPVFPGQDQVDRAKADAAAHKSAADAIQVSYDAASRQLRALEAGAAQASEGYDIAAARAEAARQTAAEAVQRLAQAKQARDDAQTQVGRFAKATYREGPDLGRVLVLMHAASLRALTDGEQAIRTVARSQAEALKAAQRAEAEATAWQGKAAAAAVQQAEAVRAAAAARDQAQVAAVAEQVQTTRLNAQRETLLAQLAAAQGIAVALERERQQGLAEQAARAAAAAREAAARQAAARQTSSSGHQSATPTRQTSWGPPANTAGAVHTMLAYIYAQLGKPYVWGGAGPDVFDCSGLAMRGLEAAGWDFPHPAQWQYLEMHSLTYSQLRPGDLVFWAEDDDNPHTIYHEAIYIGNDRIIQAPHPGGVVEIQSLWINGTPSFYGRP